MLDRFRFRAWGSFGGREPEDHMVYDWQDSLYLESLGFNGRESFTIMQCTGLKDKDGKLIYEGDILDWEDSFGQDFYVGEVFLHHGSVGPCEGPNVFEYNLRRKEGSVKTLCNLWDLNRMQIIGNVYESPELLENEKE